MKLAPVPFKKSLNKAYLKLKLNRAEMERSKANLLRLLDHIDHEESEENVKNHLRDFFNDTWYRDHHLLNTKGRTDLVIHEDKSAQSKAMVLFEVKRPRNVADMISVGSPNAKALHELLLYYLRERIDGGNTDVKYLVVTNIYEWYIFDAAIFDRQFYQNRTLRKAYEDWRDGRKAQQTTDFFYRDIARPFLENLDAELPATYFDLRQYERALRNADLRDDVQLIPVFKILSPQHLLKQPFANDSNSLDKTFYQELLYLLGLEEQKAGGKKVIQRAAPEMRQPGSLLENTMATLETSDRWRKAPHLREYGSTREEQIFGVALELCITWTNRLLFLKLLEAQLIKYHSDNSRAFLKSTLLRDFDEVNELFFEVLAKKPTERVAYARDKFSHIPYLNSSLFEISELEDATIFISNLKDRFRIKPLRNTVLKNNTGQRQTGEQGILEYLFAFLDAYDFASEGSEAIQEENKTLINASVLGLIFEKINGYRDGSFFTPGFVTMYMAQSAIREAIVRRFNEHFAIDCRDFGDLRNYTGSRFRREDVLAMNEVVNGLHLCDPAVGSGHFLVSALNELLAAKSELGILADREGNLLRGYDARVENDELIITCNDGQDLFEYRLTQGKAGHEAQRVQETFFHEKQTVIENCLFGVDINPNSVKICRLRLWIELLKNTYYLGGTEAGGLETLPNIDINIKTGNSLVSRFALDEDLRPVLRKSQWNIHDYRVAVSAYQHATDKEAKRTLLQQIGRIKDDFQTHIYQADPRRKRLAKLRGQQNLLENKAEIGDLFEKLQEADIAPDLQKINAQIDALEKEMAEIQQNVIFENAFEWRFEFPEVLDEEGNFTGFDVIIGNPPYIRQEEFSALKPYLQSQFTTYAGTADLLVYFIEQGLRLLRPGGVFSFIISNKFMRANFGKPLRQFLQQFRLQEVIDFGDLPVFEEATTYPCILHLQKEVPTGTFQAANLPALVTTDFASYVASQHFTSDQTALDANGWNLANQAVQNLLEKLRNTGVPLGEYVQGQIYRGVLTGYNEAFVIDAATREALIATDPRSAEVIKPFLAGRDVKRYQVPDTNKFLILFPKGWTISQVGKADEITAFDYLKTEYPAIANHLEPYAAAARKRSDQGDYWWELRACDYYEAFEQPKIILPDISLRGNFTVDGTGNYLANTAYMIISSDNYLLGVLCSKFVDFFYRNLSSSYRGGYLRFINQYLIQIPIIDTDPETKERIQTLVTQILTARASDPDADTTAWEAEIDALVYQLYGLTPEEVALVEESTR